MRDEYLVHGHNGGVEAGGFIVMMLFWTLIMIAVVYLVWHLSKSATSKNKSALDVLATRFANGEIDKKEYEEKHKILSNS